ncbi:MAG: cytochrome c oxidase subunit II [Blastocatellia bacterium]|nr:cytochrome c oxidase subunit II [Chloracidobacterium sp.]MBL8186131.1 cytochrome c oxidase subunit II [Blastocatellia bacterium]HRJ88516.1 cytochrome c oxidase subunit II [Pyrinomonadaceae bacterium]HRK50437.1 cytochrome c oxidase subunit II [Pyrinomonadaceae bacterium]
MQTNSWIPLFPDQASTFAWQVDYLYFYLIAVSVAFAIPIVAAVFFFVVKFREREKFATPEEMHGSIMLETVWSIIPFVISMTIFLGGAVVYYNQYRMPEDAMQVYVVGKQWMWKIQHETGQREINELHVPVGRKIKLTMTTEDVLHDFSIPAFRTKADVVPGRYTYLWFEATKPGKYHLYCAEYCGLNHSGMGGFVYVMEQRDFDNWLQGNVTGQTPVEQGRDLFENRLGCASCHAGGPQQRGAKLEGIFGKDVKLVGGQTVVANEEYLRNSILNPGSQIVEGYQPIMPTFKGQVTEEQLVSLVAYIKSLSGVTGTATTPMSSPASAPGSSTNSNTTANSNK